jgi:glycosyltransferase involved in cell wall biosynthesis
MNTCIFIPAWNVCDEVAGVLERIPAACGQGCAEVFVLDNASTDGTAQAACDRLARGLPFPVSVYRNARNLGYGGSQKMAYAHALRQGYDLVAMLHGDGQYPSEQVPALFEALAGDSALGMAYGSRMLQTQEKDQTPLIRRLGVRGLSMLQNLVSGMRLAEWYSGFRAFRCDALRQIPFQACDDDYYFDVQIILLLGMAGYQIGELAVAKKYEGRPSPVNIYQFGRKVLAHLMHYPLARCGVLPGRLYRRKHWEELRRAPVAEPKAHANHQIGASNHPFDATESLCGESCAAAS